MFHQLKIWGWYFDEHINNIVIKGTGKQNYLKNTQKKIKCINPLYNNYIYTIKSKLIFRILKLEQIKMNS